MSQARREEFDLNSYFNLKSEPLRIEVAISPALVEYLKKNSGTFQKKIPAWVKRVKLKKLTEVVLNISSDDVIWLCGQLPETATQLDLSSNLLGERLSDDFVSKVLEKIPKAITYLDLSYNGLGDQPAKLIAKMLTAIPFTVRYLNLRGNGLGHKSVEEIIMILGELPNSVTYLNLGCSSLCDKTGDKLVETLAALKTKSVTHLDLSFDELGHQPSEKIAKILSALPATVTHLDLSGNFFGNKPTDELIFIMRALPNSIKHLNLGHNRFNKRSGNELEEIMRAVPKSVKHLVLSKNMFYEKSENELTQMVQALSGVTHLELSGNHLNLKKIKSILSAIPDTVQYVDLSDNGLEYLSDNELLEVFSAYLNSKKLEQIITPGLTFLLPQIKTSILTPWSTFLTCRLNDPRLFFPIMDFVGKRITFDPKTAALIENAIIKTLLAKPENDLSKSSCENPAEMSRKRRLDS